MDTVAASKRIDRDSTEDLLQVAFSRLLLSLQSTGEPFSLIIIRSGAQDFRPELQACGDDSTTFPQPIADALRNVIRGEDFLSDFGDGRYVLLLRGIPNAVETRLVGAILAACSNGPCHEASREDACCDGVQIGFAHCPEHGRSFLELMRHAKQALVSVSASIPVQDDGNMPNDHKRCYDQIIWGSIGISLGSLGILLAVRFLM